MSSTSEGNGRLDAILGAHAGRPGAVMLILQEVQAALGYLSEETIAAIAEATGVAEAEIYGVATFYAQFRLAPAGRHTIRICHGTACHVLGAREVTRALEEAFEVAPGGTTADGRFTLEVVRCLGCCSLAPVMMIDETTYGRLTPEKAVAAVKEFARDHG